MKVAIGEVWNGTDVINILMNYGMFHLCYFRAMPLAKLIFTFLGTVTGEPNVDVMIANCGIVNNN